jgi:hypothetical protein
LIFTRDFNNVVRGSQHHIERQKPTVDPDVLGILVRNWTLEFCQNLLFVRRLFDFVQGFRLIVFDIYFFQIHRVNDTARVVIKKGARRCFYTKNNRCSAEHLQRTDELTPVPTQEMPTCGFDFGGLVMFEQEGQKCRGITRFWTRYFARQKDLKLLTRVNPRCSRLVDQGLP